MRTGHRHRRWPARLRPSTASICWTVLGLVMVGTLRVVPPYGEFAVDDDWVYAQAVRQLVTVGSYRPSVWIDAEFLAQALWGALFSSLFGFSHTTLRASTLVLSAAALALYYLLLRRSLPPGVSLLVTLLLMFNPVFLHVSYTFMTDIPFLAVVLAALWCITIATGSDGRARLGWLAVGSGLIGLSCLIRQIGIVLLPVVLVGAYPELRSRHASLWPLLAALVLPCAMVAMVAPLAYAEPRDVTVGTRLIDVLRGSDRAVFVALVLRAAALAAIFLGLSAAPVSVVALGTVGWPDWAPLRRALGSSLLLLLSVAVASRSGALVHGLAPALLAGAVWTPWQRLGDQPGRRQFAMMIVLAIVSIGTLHTATVGTPSVSPLFGNTLSTSGLTILRLQPMSIAIDGVTMVALGVCALLGALALLVIFVHWAPFTQTPVSTRILLLASTTMLLVTLGYAPSDRLYDRYLIPALPGMLAFGAFAVRERRLALPILAAGVLLFAAWSLTWQRDYMQRQAALWEAAHGLVDRGVPASEVDAGYEWNGWHRGETVIPRAHEQAARAGDPLRFVQLVKDGLYRPSSWYVDFRLPPTTCSDQIIVEIHYGRGWPVYGLRRC